MGRRTARGGGSRQRARGWLYALLLGVAAGSAWVLRDGLSGPSSGDWLPRSRAQTCRVERVLDGDSLRVRCGERRVEIRLHCIDAPERGQGPWAEQSRRHLRKLAGSHVELVELERDRYGRRVSDVFGDAPGRPLLNLEQVLSGNAAVYHRYCSDARYDRAERQARGARLGIWSSPGEQQTPWTYRRRQPRD